MKCLLYFEQGFEHFNKNSIVAKKTTPIVATWIRVVVKNNSNDMMQN